MNAMCNHSKHHTGEDLRLETRYGLPIDDWYSVDEVQDWDNGPPSGHLVDGRPVLEVVKVVLDFYRANWYERLAGVERASGARNGLS